MSEDAVQNTIRIIGLTGGTGSGKSEAARMFAARGFAVIDADAVGHGLLEPGGAAVEPVVAAFGEEVLTEGAVDRAKLGRIVFDDPEARKRLNGIIHPLIYREMAARCASLAQEGHIVVLVDAALIAEDGQREPWLDGLIVVTCPREIRLQRLVEGRGISCEEAERRMAAQSEPEKKVALADWVIQNDGTIKLLGQRVDEIARMLRTHD